MMDNLKIIPAVTPPQIEEIARLAEIIWRQHFTPIIGTAQVDYMLEKFQSAPAISRQIEEGYQYYLLTFHDESAGYSGIQIRDKTLFLSKLYLKEEFRGKKISSAVLRFYEEICREHNLEKIWLTCNRDNENTLAAYASMGFATVETKAADIGGGFVMDDYILEKQL